MQPSKYGFELWSRSGQLLADLTGRANNRHLVMSRNEAEDIQWSAGLNMIEDYARRLKTTARDLITTGQTEIRIRRGAKYLCGGRILYRAAVIDSNSQVLDMRASGFLNMFLKRRTAELRTFTAIEATTIATTIITESQSQGPNWDLGITIGPQATVGPHDRTYQRTQLKALLQELTTVQTHPFDFEFTADKVFKTYESIGSQRSDIVFEYPGNILKLTVPEDATNLENEVLAYGSGSGTEAGVNVIVDESNSQDNYGVAQDVYTDSSILEQDTLRLAGETELAKWAYPFELPTITVNGNVPPYVTDYGIGDYVRVRASGYSMIDHINAMYRIEKIDLTVDDDDNEIVTLTLSQ